MRQAAIYLIILQISTLSVFKGGILGEMCLLSNVFEHYEEHVKESDGQMTIFEFIRLHYFDEDHSSSDFSHHSKIPLSNHGGSHFHQVLFHKTDVAELDGGFKSELIKVYGVENSGAFVEGFHLDIFRPPSYFL